jgi:glucose/arabinose dehydrogenase
VAALRGQGILWIQFDSSDPDKITSSQKLENIEVGRVREVTEGPDGYIYFTSSNTDGRGKKTTGDDKVYRLVPADM